MSAWLLMRAQWPALWPPSTCRISPVTKGALSRNRMASTMSRVTHASDRMQFR
jgi:hypothetical protein